MNLKNARPGVYAAHQAAMLALEEGKRLTSYVLPPRYGKTDLIRINCAAFIESDRIAVNVVVTPWIGLQDQFHEPLKWKAAVERYQADWSGLRVARHRGNLKEPEDLWPNCEHIVSMTTHLFALLNKERVFRDQSVLMQFIDHVRHTTGKTVAFHLDEGHLEASQQTWGATAEACAKAGAYVLLYTGSPYRDDGDLIPGFARETINEKPYSVVTHEPGSEPYLIRINILEGMQRTVRLRADYEHSIELAITEGYLLKSSHETVDIDLSLISEAESREFLSHMSESECRAKLGRIVRSPVATRLCVEELLRRLATMQRLNPRASAIVYCGNDQPDDDEGNAHAKAIQREILRRDRSRAVAIATLKNDPKAEGVAADIINAYRDERKYDILIVKQMGGVGLDADHCKVVLDLSSVRTLASCLQRWLRGGTVWENFPYYVLITLADAVGRAIYDVAVGSVGGSTTRVEDLDLIRSYERERRDQREREAILIHDAIRGDFRDSDGHEALRGLWPAVDALMLRFPTLEQETPASIAETIAPHIREESRLPFDVSARVETLKEEIRGTLGLIAGKRMASGAYDSEAYGEVIADLWNRLKERSGVRTAVPLSDIRDIPTLERLSREAAVMLAEMI